MKGWHFLRSDKKLRYGDGRTVEEGRTYVVPDDRPLELCDYGLHASKRIINALSYAPGPIVCRVELLGERIDGDDKSVAYERKVLWMLDATDVLRRFARLCALDVIHLWDAPPVVVEYLKTGREDMRSAAYVAADEASGFDAYVAADEASGFAADAARCAASYVARYSAWYAARNAVGYSAQSAAWYAARYAAEHAVWDVARSAAWDAARTRQNRRLAAMVIAARKKEGK